MRINILASWAYLRTINYQEYTSNVAKHANLMVDSGAFTDYWARIKASIGKSKGYVPVNLEEYMKACVYFDALGAHYIALDYVRHEDQTMINMRKMVDAGLRPIPIFVEGGNHKNLLEMKDVNRNNMICVPGAAKVDKVYFHDRMWRVKQHAPWANIHALGYFRLPNALKLPIYSCDSTTWVDAQRYGHIIEFDGRKFKGLNKDMDLARYCSPDDLKVKSYWHTGSTYGNAIAMISFIQAMEYCTQRNLHYYLVECTGTSQLLKVIVATLIANNHKLSPIVFNPKIYQHVYDEVSDLHKNNRQVFWKLWQNTLEGSGFTND